MSVGSLNPILFIRVQQRLATGTYVFRVGSYGLYLDLVPSDQPARISFLVFVIPNDPTFETVNLFRWPGRNEVVMRDGTLKYAQCVSTLQQEPIYQEFRQEVVPARAQFTGPAFSISARFTLPVTVAITDICRWHQLSLTELTDV